MSLIVDGYNVILGAGLLETNRRGNAADDRDSLALNRARFRLIERVARHIPKNSVAVVVFDAKNPPPGAPKQFSHHGVTVMFAVDHDEADDLIEQLIRAHSTPKKLLVVSSDHRLQAATRRRKAASIDVDDWLDRLEAAEAKQTRLVNDDSHTNDQEPDATVDEWLKFLEIDNAETLVDSLETPVEQPNTTEEALAPKSEKKSEPASFAELFGTDIQIESMDDVSQFFPEDWLSEIQDDVDKGKL